MKIDIQKTIIRVSRAVAVMAVTGAMVAPPTLSAPLQQWVPSWLQAGEAQAQDISKRAKKRKSATDEKTRDEASKRLSKQSDRLNKKRQELDPDAMKKAGPGADREAFEAGKEGLTPEEIDKLKRRIEAKNKQMIAKLDTILEKTPPGDARRPEYMFQKAELVWELKNYEYLRARAKYNQCLEAAGNGTIDESKCQEPQGNFYQDAEVIYEDILKQAPGYNRLDEVIYRLGRSYREAGKGAQAVALLQRLVQNYPNSKYRPEAHLALGEHFFDKRSFALAETNFKEIQQKYKSYAMHDYANYMLGWVYINVDEYRQAIDTFKQVVESKNSQIGFQDKALNDLVMAFSHVKDGWKEARAYLGKLKKDDEFIYKKVGQMAGLYEGQGKDDEAIAIYNWFLKERPTHPQVPEWWESKIVALKRDTTSESFPKLEEAINQQVAFVGKESTWYRKNKDNEKALNNARLLSEASLGFLAATYHKDAQTHDERKEEADARKDYEKAAKYYAEFIRRFPDADASFDMNFFLGEIYLRSLDRLEDAAGQYQLVVDLYRSGNYPKSAKKEDIEAMVQDAAYNAVSSYNELVKKHHPDSILTQMAEREESNPGGEIKVDQKQDLDAKPIPEQPLAKYEQGFVKASDQFSEMYPKEDITPTVDFVSAEVYKSRGRYPNAVPRYESIIKNAPKHRYAAFAGVSLLDANYRLKRWQEVEKWARHLMDTKNKHLETQKLIDAIAYAINEMAKGKKGAGQTEEAAQEYLRLVKEFPKQDLAPQALFNAAAVYDAASDYKKAFELYERVVDEYHEKNSDLAANALYVMGKISQAQADFDGAAAYFARLGTKEYQDNENAPDAVFQAAAIQRALKQYDKSIDTFESYIQTFPHRENIRRVELDLAYLDLERAAEAEGKDKEKALKSAQSRFEKFLKRKDLKPAERIQIYNELGLILEETRPRRWEKESDEYFTKAVTLYKEKLPEMKEAAAAGGDAANKLKSAKRAAAQARFRQAERALAEFHAYQLSDKPWRLKKSLEEKAVKLQTAEKIYNEVVDMQHPLYLAAAAYRIGELYNGYYKSLYDYPTPKGLTEDQEFAYRDALDMAAAPLQEKALVAFQDARKLAIKYEAYNEWSAKSAKQISELEADAYPITEQEGVETGHNRLNFTATAPVVDFEVAVDRAAARKEAREVEKAPAEPAAPGNKDGKPGTQPAAGEQGGAPQATRK